MGASKKTFVLFFAFILSLYAIWPMPRTYAAAKITRFIISTPYQDSYLIAGTEYPPYFESDKASTTSVENSKYEYSTDNGATWIYLPTYRVQGYSYDVFMLPIKPQLISAMFRVSAYFNPIIGSRSYSEKIIGPYKILQPASLTDVIATPNDDGTVRLTWNDNSNMESQYQITRNGPDGTKTFYVNNTMDNIGPLSYDDKQTNQDKSTIYVYSLSAVIDKYNLPDDLQPGIVYVTAKTKVPLKPLDKFKSDPYIFIPPGQITSDSSISKYIEKFNLYIGDFNKAAVSGVTLNNKAITLETGESQPIIASVTPADAANQMVTWSSNNKQVADVDSTGKVTGKSPGSAKIIVKTESGGFTDVCVVTVTGIPESKSPNPDNIVLPNLTDISGHWASSDIAKAVALGFVNGYPDGTFRPDASITRAEFTIMLMKGLKTTVEGSPLTFVDKDEIGAWAVKSVAQGVQIGIISGYEDGTFQPNANITHAEMIAMVIRSSGLSTGSAQKTSYADDEDIPKWAKASVSKAEETGIIIVGGISDKFAPQNLSTRAEAASAIVRMLKIRK